MAVKRSQNWLSQQRVDVPHLLSVESAVRSDFDSLLDAFCTGASNSYILRGFDLNMVGAIGSSANALQMIVSDSSILHNTSATSGTFFTIASGTANQTLNSVTNTHVNGSFTPSSLNYIGLDFVRAADSSTTSQVYFWDATNDTEFTKNVPLAQTLDYQVVISAASWSSTTLPVAIIRTDSSNNVTEVSDYRPMFFRLGTGGYTTPNPYYVYPWTHHTEGRVENFWQSTTATSPFRGGDKMLKTDKEWKDAVMSMILEVKGTTYWYSPNAGGSIIKLRMDLANMIVSGSGNITHNAITAGQINWSSDIFLNLIGSRLSYKISVNAATTDVTLADNQVAYITLVRGVDITPNLIFTSGSATVTSVGAVVWTTGLVSGDFVKVASEDDTHYYKISTVDSGSQVTLTSNFLETSTGVSGIQAKYAWGVYSSNPAPSTNRHIYVVNRKDVPFTEDTYWLMFRADDGGIVPTVFLRFPGGELRQGESMRINDDVSIAILNYTGMTSEADSSPNYSNNNYVTDATSLTTAIGDLDGTIMRNTHQDRNSKLILGGSWTWTQATQLLSCTDWAYIQVAGLAKEVNRITAASIAAAGAIANDECLYVSLNRSGGGGVLAIVKDTVTGITDHVNKKIIARRVDSRVLSSASFDTTVGGVGNFGSGTTFNVLLKGGVANTFTCPAGINTAVGLQTELNTAGNWGGGVPVGLSFVVAGTDVSAELTITSTVPCDLVEFTFLTVVNLVNSYLVGTRVYVGDGLVLQDLETRVLAEDTVTEDDEDRNFKLIEGGSWSWNLGTGTLTWSADSYINIGGLDNSANTISAGNVAAIADGEVVYVSINRSGTGGIIAPSKAAIASYVPSQNKIIIARRLGNYILVGDQIVLADGESKPLIESDLVNNDQDRNMKIIKGGLWSWDLATNTLSTTASAYISLPGIAEARNEISTFSTAGLNVDGMLLYCDVNRLPGIAATISITAVAVASYVPSQDRLVIARRVNDDIIIGRSILLKNGQSLYLDDPDSVVNDTRFRCTSQLTPDKTVSIWPSKRFSNGRTIYTYLTADTSSKFPRTAYSTGTYDGGTNHNQLVTITFSDIAAGLVTVTATGPTFGAQVLGTFAANVSEYVPVLLVANENDTLSFTAGSSYATYNLATTDDNLPKNELFKIAIIVYYSDGAGVCQPLSELYIRDRRAFGGGSGGSGKANVKTISQVLHGFAVKDCIYHNATWQKADNTDITKQAIAVVTKVADADSFQACFEGYVDTLSALTADTLYYVSNTGAISSTETKNSAPILFALSTTEAVILPYRPLLPTNFGITSNNTQNTDWTILNGETAMLPRATGTATVTINVGGCLWCPQGVTGLTILGGGDLIS